MSDIRPIDLPTSAGLSFGKGDVRHFSESDAVNVVGLQNPTRHLAERDNILASKINELVAEINNKEQFVPLAVPRTAIPPGTEEVITNFAIPAGFEARILNATIGSTPASADLLLKVYFASGYGNVAGTELVSTTSTFASGVAFYNQGEFIVALRNNGVSTLDAVASLTLTVRPIGSTSSLLVGSVIQGKQGLPGSKGDRGLKGDPGTGGDGDPGMVWMGAYNSSTSYAHPQVVSYVSGGVTQSYICTRPNPYPPQPPTNTAYWDLVVSSGSSGSALAWRGTWSNSLTYAVNDMVSDTVGGSTASYICWAAVNPPSAVWPGGDPTHWGLMATSGTGETPSYTVTDVTKLFSYTASPPQPADYPLPSGPYIGYGANDVLVPLPSNIFREFTVQNSSAGGLPRGLVFINGQWMIYMAANGSLTLGLPVSPTLGTQWTSNNVNLTISNQGSIAVYGTNAHAIDVITPTAFSGTFVFTNHCAWPATATISLSGVRLFA